MSKNSFDHIPVKEISELLEISTQKLPELIRQIMKTFYSPEAASEMGKAVGSLYKELVHAGIPQDIAIKMAHDYMVSLKDLIQTSSFSNKTFYDESSE
ncbi:hypothetical protein [Thermoflavimicrobium daqui]|uniref:Uncharacterized protein n=1 Tax=Thermoflavimicrobium daqui TaxID=2137476 RepID=A0A364K6N8_9BACL|nr:hypothetical protein [Thermoflavimicrobium daqui]RAL25872.1 hypothetical protein DL897_07285 [Thermoflavimicrobium daqui]